MNEAFALPRSAQPHIVTVGRHRIARVLERVAVDCQQRIQALNPAMAALLGAPAAQWHGRVLGSVAQALLQRRLKTLAVDAPATLQTLLTAVLQQAQTHRWPGNVRELENWVERLLACHAALCDAQGVLDAARLLDLFPECAAPQPTLALKDTRRQAEQQRLREVLESVGGDQRQACAILGISRATLWRRMRS